MGHPSTIPRSGTFRGDPIGSPNEETNNMDMINIWKTVVLQRYAKFDGRASRAEFWWFVLANFLVYIVLAILLQVASIFIVLYVGYWIATIIPSLAVGIRRLHDTNKSGWFLLLSLIPIVGGIILIVFLATEGTNGPNDHGAAAEPAVA
jgi:uncharacterized membrane protein YhaH (DUF805 family)